MNPCSLEGRIINSRRPRRPGDGGRQAERDDRAVSLQQVRTRIGRAAYELAVARGAAMNDDEAITYALDQLDTAETRSLAQSAVAGAPRARAAANNRMDPLD